MANQQQYDLFTLVETVFKSNPGRQLTNNELYDAVASSAGITQAALHATVPIGSSGSPRSTVTRAIRWHQQTLKALDVIERVPGERGIWQLTEKARKDLHRVKPGVTLLGFSTSLGLALWGTSPTALAGLEEPITCVLTSPPYPLQSPRAYGNPSATEFADFICAVLEPLVPKLSAAGSVVLNVSNDIFLPKSPARSTYLERMVIAIEDRLGLSLMDRLIWENRSKAPGPLQWASKTRQQLNVAWEPVYWFAKDPRQCKADNRRVLQPHTDRHKQLITQGGERRTASYGDGAFRLRPGSYGQATAGAIPKNVLQFGHACGIGRQHRQALSAAGLPTHSAPFPLALAEFLVQFLSDTGDVVIDLFAGRCMTGLAAERLGRRWICVESVLEYVQGASMLFRGVHDLWVNPDLNAPGS
ncbi:site-specific DNA-methyltransferase [Pseudomonas sp. GM_Psu_2]|uniref:site-specific DNA-methyltransferase n=1 Tax=unclassified Pseudomonas TaxID=196821 RepID=UPI00226AB6B6|nr:site-specific DNA-methyltransferase [Pseudomonas sp. GM_Psu_2]